MQIPSALLLVKKVMKNLIKKEGSSEMAPFLKASTIIFFLVSNPQ